MTTHVHFVIDAEVEKKRCPNSVDSGHDEGVEIDILQTPRTSFKQTIPLAPCSLAFLLRFFVRIKCML